MSYTPTQWVDGDVITAEKLNKIEEGVEEGGPGYEVEESKSLFYEGTINCTSGYHPYYAYDWYDATLDSDMVEVIFDGTTYVLEKAIYSNGNIYYGDDIFGSTAFQNYPFEISGATNSTVHFYTENAGEYEVKITSINKTITPSNDFKRAITDSVTFAEKVIFAVNLGTITYFSHTPLEVFDFIKKEIPVFFECRNLLGQEAGWLSLSSSSYSYQIGADTISLSNLSIRFPIPESESRILINSDDGSNNWWID